MLTRALVALGMLLVGAAAAATGEPREVRTRAGLVRGYRTDEGYYAFTGIPYAKPMTKMDRFKAPEPPLPWDGVLEASRRVRCPQSGSGGARGLTGAEHCLVVNVMTAALDLSWARPVLVIVHGGDFATGWGAYKPPERFAEDFVVVTFNYRLGALGFLCLGTTAAPGNAGLKDQVAAMYWVHKNIDSFGGNPDDVTVYGIGSGSASVQVLLLSRLTRGLIHRVILESGSLLSPSMMTYTPYATAHQAATSMRFEGGNVRDLVVFYKKLPLQSLVNMSAAFLPCVETNFYHSYSLLDKDPLEILRAGNFDKVPMLVAYTNAQEVDLITQTPDLFSSLPKYFEEVLPSNLVFDSNFTRHRVADAVKAFYFGDRDKDLTAEEMLADYVEYITDIFMDYPVVKFSVLYASKSMTPVYLMKFSYNGGRFGDLFSIINGNLQDEWVADKLVTLWRKFMTLNDPTPLTTSLVPVIWQPIRAQDEGHQLPITKASWLVFASSLAMSEVPSSQRLEFWDHIYGKFYKIHVFDKLDLEER